LREARGAFCEEAALAPTRAIYGQGCIAGSGGRKGADAKIRTVLEAIGVEFIDENGGGPGVRLRKPPRVLCHEHRRSKRRCVTVREMKVGPSSSAIRC